jgi:putative ABC transport system permease protein
MRFHFIYRQISSSWTQTIIFVLCVALALVTLVSLGGFGESVNNSLLRDARRLQAGDIIVESGFEYSPSLAAELAAVAQEPGVARVNLYEFISVVQSPQNEESLLTSVKVVEPGYPFYGEVLLASTRPWTTTLQPGTTIVEQNLLDRLGLAIGNELRVGEQTLQIVDVVTYEPDRPVAVFSVGPRVFVHADDLAATGLIRPGSRVTYKTLFQVPDEAQMNALAERLEAATVERERVDTFRTAQSAVQIFFDNFLTFLRLIGIFTLLLAGIGTQSSLTAFLKERENTIAILRTFGATNRFVLLNYLGVTAVLGFVGTLIGFTVALLLQLIFPIIFATFLPPQVELVISPRAILEALALGILVVAAFTFLPIYNLQGVKPSFIFRKETLPLRRGWAYYLTVALILSFFWGMVLYYLQEVRTGLYFMGGVLGLILLTGLLTAVVLYLLRRLHLQPLAPRQALRGLFRPRNATFAIIVTLSSALAVLFTIFLIQQNLEASFVQAYPDDAPNLFVLDIQPDQRELFQETVGQEVTLFPIVNGRISAINGVPLDREAEQAAARTDQSGENLARPFNLTYRAELLPSERLVRGENLHETMDGSMPEVSLLDELLTRYDFQVGDTITFDIQGVPLTARVTSIRQEVGAEGLQPRFSFVLREQDLINAPQTIFTAVRLPPEEIPAMQNKLVAAMPNLTVVNVNETITTIAGIVNDVVTIIRFFTLFSIIAGVLIIISSVLATRFARIQESVYFKVLGATRRFVLQVFALENVFIGTVAALLAVGMSQIGGYLLITRVFELTYQPYWGESFLLLLGTVGLVTAVGLLASTGILQKKPIIFLREQAENE